MLVSTAILHAFPESVGERCRVQKNFLLPTDYD